MTADRLEFDVFGRRVQVRRERGGWVAYYSGNDGKRRRASDIVLPPAIAANEVHRYLDDLCHEWATPEHPRVERVG